jgi:hypothetical protein
VLADPVLLYKLPRLSALGAGVSTPRMRRGFLITSAKSREKPREKPRSTTPTAIAAEPQKCLEDPVCQAAPLLMQHLDQRNLQQLRLVCRSVRLAVDAAVQELNIHHTALEDLSRHNTIKVSRLSIACEPVEKSDLVRAPCPWAPQLAERLGNCVISLCFTLNSTRRLSR